VIAENLRVLKRRIDEYLWWEDSLPLERLRLFLRREMLPFRDVAIVGGLVRDFARKGKVGFKSDIDLVINAPAQAVSGLADKLRASPNRFGGFGYQSPHWKIDFWALETTWAARHGHASVRNIDDITSCTFFDWDASAYHLHSKKLIIRDDYLDRIRSRTLDVNLLPNPSLDGNLLRAIRRILLWNLRAGPELSSFIVYHLNDNRFEALKAHEGEVFDVLAMSKYNNSKSIIDDILDWESRCVLNPSFGQQLELDFGLQSS
jgi:hypothetical protein